MSNCICKYWNPTQAPMLTQNKNWKKIVKAKCWSGSHKNMKMVWLLELIHLFAKHLGSILRELWWFEDYTLRRIICTTTEKGFKKDLKWKRSKKSTCSYYHVIENGRYSFINISAIFLTIFEDRMFSEACQSM